MQVNNPQKPKNSAITLGQDAMEGIRRLTEPVNLDEGSYIAGKISSEDVEELKNRYPEMYR